MFQVKQVTIFDPPNQLLQEHAEIAEEDIPEKISARFASSCKILEAISISSSGKLDVFHR